MNQTEREIARIKTLMVESNLILEMSKRDILINKVGLSEKNADFVYNVCGKLSIFIVNKFIDFLYDFKSDASKKDIIDEINSMDILQNEEFNFIDILDYIKIELKDDISALKNMSYYEIFNTAKTWKDYLTEGIGDVNYLETNDVILDFRNDKKFGYYWVNLNTDESKEECNRLQHCGKSSFGETLYSLRKNQLINDRYFVNTSHITMSVTNNGEITQIAGKHNTSPKDIYLEYIKPIFMLKINGEYFIKSLNRFVFKKGMTQQLLEFLKENRKDLFR